MNKIPCSINKPVSDLKLSTSINVSKQPFVQSIKWFGRIRRNKWNEIDGENWTGLSVRDANQGYNKSKHRQHSSLPRCSSKLFAVAFALCGLCSAWNEIDNKKIHRCVYSHLWWSVSETAQLDTVTLQWYNPLTNERNLDGSKMSFCIRVWVIRRQYWMIAICTRQRHSLYRYVLRYLLAQGAIQH